MRPKNMGPGATAKRRVGESRNEARRRLELDSKYKTREISRPGINFPDRSTKLSRSGMPTRLDLDPGSRNETRLLSRPGIDRLDQEIELNGNNVAARFKLDLDKRKETREIFRPGIDLPDRTVELDECDMIVVTAPRSTSVAPPIPKSESWALEALVEVDDDVQLVDDDIVVVVEEEPEDSPLDFEHKGFFWRLLFRLGWVSPGGAPEYS